MENSPYPQYWRVGWNLQLYNLLHENQRVGGNLFLEKNKRACLFIKEVRVINSFLFWKHYKQLNSFISFAFMSITNDEIL